MKRNISKIGKPKIAYILQMFGIGGMPKWFYRLALELQNEFEFHFIATHSSFIVPKYYDVAKVAIVPYNKYRLAGYLFLNAIDIAQVANLRLYTDAALLARVPSIVERVDGLRGGAALNSKQGIDVVIASTRGVTKHLETLIESDKIKVIYNGIDVDAHDNVAPERFGFDDMDVIIGRTTRLAEGKNISLLIKAVIELRKLPGYGHVRLVICGGDTTQSGAIPMLQRLKAEAAPLAANIMFTGEVHDTKAITKGFDIATCTSNPDNEGIPNSLLEAMAAGKPVVSSDVGDIQEIVEDGITGFLFPSNDLDGLVKALKRLVDDEGLRRSMGAKGKSIVMKKFDLEIQADCYRKLYRQLIDIHGYAFLNRLKP